LYTLNNFAADLPPHLRSLFDYLMDNDKMEAIEDANTNNLHIISDNVVAMIKKGEEGWEKMVPFRVQEIIKEFGLFDYPYSTKDESPKISVAS
jgi:hypothetical protein